jgi:hypothetical protein
MKSLIAMLFVAVLAVPTYADLLGYWRFDGNTNDSSGNGNDGELMNGASLSGDIPAVFTAGQSLLLAGGNQHVLVPHDPSLDVTSRMTITAWVKPVGNAGWDGVLAKNPSDGSNANHAGNYELRIENVSRQPHFLYQRGGANDTVFPIATSAPIPEGQWSHLAVTVEAGATVDYYLNGAYVESVGVQSTFGATNSNPLYIGSRADLFTTFDGLIDEVAIFDEVLSGERIQQISAGALIPEPSAAMLAFVAAPLLLRYRKR